MLTDYFLSHGLSFFASGWMQFGAAFGVAFLIMLLFGRPFIRAMHAWQKRGQPISENVPDTHRKKAGTPTMGGILVIIAMLGKNFRKLFVYSQASVTKNSDLPVLIFPSIISISPPMLIVGSVSAYISA